MTLGARSLYVKGWNLLNPDKSVPINMDILATDRQDVSCSSAVKRDFLVCFHVEWFIDVMGHR